MFQYAAGRALSLEKGTNLRLDIGGFDRYRLHHGFELHRVFNVPVEIATSRDLSSVLGWRSVWPFRGALNRRAMFWLRGHRFAVEEGGEPATNLLKRPGDCYIQGYWQSERYFEKVSDVIRRDFSFRVPMNSKNLMTVRQIEGCNAVSLHVRRGDYATNPTTMAIHGLCSVAYYREAIAFLNRRMDNPVYFVFSDDASWARAELGGQTNMRFVKHNVGNESYNDMRLMAACTHHIIANSSFSWWGAWLNSNRNKIVIAPKRWFASDRKAEGLIPKSWIQI